jgi:hypothetical protein
LISNELNLKSISTLCLSYLQGLSWKDALDFATCPKRVENAVWMHPVFPAPKTGMRLASLEELF